MILGYIIGGITMVLGFRVLVLAENALSDLLRWCVFLALVFFLYAAVVYFTGVINE